MTDNPVRILVLEHDPSDPLLRLGDWLAEAGAVTTVCKVVQPDSAAIAATALAAKARISREICIGIRKNPDEKRS